MLTRGDNSPDSQEILRILLAAHPELRNTIQDDAVEDETIIKYLLEYARTLSTGKSDCEAHFIAYIVVTTSRVQPSLAERLVAAVEAAASSSPRMAARLRDLFDPVVEGQPNVRTWQVCLRNLLAEGSIYGLGTQVFADRVRGAAKRGSKHRFLIGFRAFLETKGVPHRKAHAILRRVGILLAPLGLGLLGGAGLAQAAEGATVREKVLGASRSFKLGIAALLAFVALISGRQLLSCEGCAQQRAKSKGVLSEPSDSDGISATQRAASTQGNVDADYADAGTVIAMPADCARLVPGPDRKECLIKLADGNRDSMDRAEHLYKLAIADSYDSATVVGRNIDRYWHFGPFWSDWASGNELLKAQNHNAMLALTTLYAKASRFLEASATWAQSIEMVYRGGGAFGQGQGDCGSYIAAFLYRKAGLRDPSIYGPSWAGCEGQLMLEAAARKAADGETMESFKTLAQAFYYLHTRSQDAVAPLVHPEKDVHWAGILPAMDELYDYGRGLRRILLDKLKDTRQAVEFNDTAILLNGGTLTAALFPDSEPFCTKWNGSPANTTEVFLSIAIDVAGRKFADHPIMSGTPLAEASFDATSQGTFPIATHVLGLTRKEMVWHECEDKTAEAILCRTAGGTWLLGPGQKCR